MNSAKAIERASLLISQHRYDMAQEVLHQVLAQEPENARAHSWLALCLSQDRDQLKQATREAEQGVFLAPDDPFAHYILATVWENRNQNDQALAAIEEAIALNPIDAAFHGFKAQLLYNKNNWRGALRSAEEGLQFDPEDEACGALRSLALERLGKLRDADSQAEEALRNNPDSSWAHASKGWAKLQQRDYRAAQQSFAESLRLSPNNEMARTGMIQALNSSNFIYRWFYWLMIQISRLDSRTQWFLIIGLWFGIRFLNQIARKNPAFAPWVLPITLFYMLLVMMSWLMAPLFNTMLRFHPFGKHLLTKKEKWASNLIAGTLALSILSGLLLAWLHGDFLIFVLPLIGGILLTIPIGVPFNCDALWARTIAIVVAQCFAILYLGMLLLLGFDVFLEVLWMIYVVGILVYSVVGQLLIKVEPRY